MTGYDDESCPGSIRYLSADDIETINHALIQILTPNEPIGVMNRDALESAVASPSLYRYYEQCNDLVMLAAVLAHSLAKAHAFLNANKRTAAHCASMFLMMNGYELTAPDHEVVDYIEGLVVGRYGRDEFADWLAYWIRPFDASQLNDPLD